MNSHPSDNKSIPHQKKEINLPKGVTIIAKDLSKRFNREWIFRKLNYQFIAGNTYAITGPNGSGKSTFLAVLSGQVPPTSGTVQYQDLQGKDIEVDDIYKSISIAAPYMDLIDEFTLYEQLKFHFSLKKLRLNLSLEELMNLMYLEHARDKYINNFSSGMKQRVKLALAFYTQSDIILLDEPGTNLDKQAFDWYIRELRNLPKESTILIASNNASEYPESAQILNIQEFK